MKFVKHQNVVGSINENSIDAIYYLPTAFK